MNTFFFVGEKEEDNVSVTPEDGGEKTKVKRRQRSKVTRGNQKPPRPTPNAERTGGVKHKITLEILQQPSI